MPGPDKAKAFLQRTRTRENLPRFRYSSTQHTQPHNYVYAFPFKNSTHWFVVHVEQEWFTNMADVDFVETFTPSNRMSRDAVASVAGRLSEHTRPLSLNPPMQKAVEAAVKEKGAQEKGAQQKKEQKKDSITKIAEAGNGPLKTWRQENA